MNEKKRKDFEHFCFGSLTDQVHLNNFSLHILIIFNYTVDIVLFQFVYFYLILFFLLSSHISGILLF